MKVVDSIKRKRFLTEYFDLLGAKKIEWTKYEEDKIFGQFIYNDNHPEQIREFCWSKSEDDVPTEKVIELIKLIKENNLIETDKITVSIKKLFNKSNEIDFVQFNETATELLDIEVPIFENGEEVDSFLFIHKW